MMKIMSETEDKIVVPDKPEISKKVKVDLEVDTSIKDLGPNPGQRQSYIVQLTLANIPKIVFNRFNTIIQMCNRII